MILIKTEQRDLDLGKFPSSQAVAASLESLFHGFPAPFLELKKMGSGCKSRLNHPSNVYLACVTLSQNA